jgi:hypothetical protein
MKKESVKLLNNLSTQTNDLKRYKALNSSADDKEIYVDQIIISYPAVNKILSDIDSCKNSSYKLQEPKCMFIAGDSRHGKTAITNVVMHRYPDIITDSITLKPTLYFKVPSPAYTGSLKSRILEALGDPFYDKVYKHQQSDARIDHLLKKCKVELIMVDEFQQLIDSKRHKVLMDTSDWFKDLIDKLRISIVFIGLPYSERVLTENAQLGNRIPYRHKLKPFDFDDKGFRVFLARFDEKLPFENMSNLAQPGTWEKIYLATGGVVGFVKLLLRESTKLAALENLPCISDEILFKAYNRVLYFLSTDNPFSPTYNLRKAIKDKTLS